MSRRKKKTSGGVSEEIRRRHAWLELLQKSGPFLTLPVVHTTFPNGLPVVPTRQRAATRALIADMLDTRGASRHRVIGTMLRDVLDWQHHLLIDTEVPDELTEVVAGHATVLRPDFAFRVETDAEDVDDEEEDDEEPDDEGDSDDATGEDQDEAGAWRMLGSYLPWGQHPLTRTTESGVTASGAERLAVLLRARSIPIGLVTDGRWWAIVWAPRGGTTGVAVWDASLFSEEPQSFEAFVALLNRARFLGVDKAETLPRLLLESLERQEEVTEALGAQVRTAVEMLIAKIDQLDRDNDGRILADVGDDEFYAGVVTVMMRVVFLLFAEERRLLPSDDDIYVTGYSVGFLVDQLDKRASYGGEQSLRHRSAAWNRLLALSRAVHAGIAHEDLRLPAYGGELFDPDRYPWLEGRTAGAPTAAADPPAVDDLTVLRILRAVQFVEIDGETRRLTFRSLDVEQIGYVYEGLLELEVRTAPETTLSLIRPASWPRLKNSEVKQGCCELPLSEIVEQQAQASDDRQLAEFLAGYCALTADKIQAELATEPAQQRLEALKLVVGVATNGYQQVAPVLGVVRTDDRGLPVVIPAGGRYVARSTRRASSGTHYTPRRLAEEVVRHALEPLVFRPGPLENADSETWILRPSTEILDLRVADIAMGSGAFLVAACRYLADHVVTAWENEGRHDATLAALQRTGQRLATDSEVDDVVLQARRLVAEHCLYGVDINPLAVSMAKLSLWLITMDRERPFGFLDDRLVAGDSLLGLVAVDQLDNLHIDPRAGQRLNHGTLDFTEAWRAQLQRAADLRRRITAAPAITIRDIEHKMRLLDEAKSVELSLVAVADAITAAGITAAGVAGKKQDAKFIELAVRISGADDEMTDVRAWADLELQAGRPEEADPRIPLHWPIAFPEIFADSRTPGFHAIIGNPPFLGGQKITKALGKDYLNWLQVWDGNNVKGSADLAARFLLRAERLVNDRGQIGFVTVNTLIETVTMKVGMEQFAKRMHVRFGRTSHPWPTRSANVSIVEVWASRTRLSPAASLWLDGEEVPSIGPDLDIISSVPGRPHKLLENEDIAFIGSYVLGLGFMLTDEERAELLIKDSRNDALIQPFVTGKDLNQRPDGSASRWIINFGARSLEEAEEYPDLLEIVRARVKPQREKDNRENYREYWWRYAEHRPGLYDSISEMESVMVWPRVSSTLMPMFTHTGPVFAEKVIVSNLADYASLAFMSSNSHAVWVIRYTSTMRTDLNYSPEAVFATLPRPKATPELEELGKALDETRRSLMLEQSLGMTKLYNKVRDEAVRAPEIVALRGIHTEIDHAVLSAYGWTDIDPKVGIHITKIGPRWTVCKEARFEILDRLRSENERRFLEQPR